MSLCNSCKYQYYVEQLKPCIILRDDCEFYEYDGISKEEHYESCDACGHLNETDGGNCYECVKGIRNHYSSKEEKEMANDLTTYQIYLILLGCLTERRDDTQMLKSMLIELYNRASKEESEDKCKNCKYYPQS